jgi:methylated-DNA-[protein]-cysteine S-methyltransferase
MTAHGFTVFPTALGHCGLAWSERGIAGSQLPEATEQRTRERMRERFPHTLEAEPPPPVREAVEAIVALFAGARPQLSTITLDLAGIPAFHRRVYHLVRTIPPGETLTYRAVAQRLGVPGAARAVGQAMARNPFAPIVPCHRVVAANGKGGGFSAFGGMSTKRMMLAIERGPARAALL